MCFSAGASFTTSAVLAATGVASLRSAKGTKEKMFAGIPLIFAVQQFAEGGLWLALSGNSPPWLEPASMYTFLFFAQFIWPLWVPLTILLLEKHRKRKMFLYLFMTIGGLVSAYLGICLLQFPVSAEIDQSHILYHLEFPAALAGYGGFLYLIATIMPPFFSSHKGMWLMSSAILISYLITVLIYRDYVISVWCFFAAVISIVVWWIVKGFRINEASTS